MSGIIVTRRSNVTWGGTCPFCEEEALAVSAQDHGGMSLFYCFGCGRSGSAVVTVDPTDVGQAMASVRPVGE